MPVCTWDTGDVLRALTCGGSRFRTRFRSSRDELRDLPEGPITTDVPPLPPHSIVASLVEGWRGEICHVALTDGAGQFSRYKVIDPSFHNWFGLALAMRGQEISDFPLCNKSFNLSYSGFDFEDLGLSWQSACRESSSLTWLTK